MLLLGYKPSLTIRCHLVTLTSVKVALRAGAERELA
jgi:hypothetical protein